MQYKSERLQKIISAYGITSRRNAEMMICDGRVSVNGTVAKLGQSAVPGRDIIMVDGRKLTGKNGSLYIMLNKPRGYVTTAADDRLRPTVMELVEDAGARIYPVGRLDMDSEGLLLFTNDGRFANEIAHPSHNKTKTYEVRVAGDAKKAARLLSRPIKVDGVTVHAVDVKVTSVTANRGMLTITIAEGRNKQIRKMCAASGVRVITLRRISIGSLKLGTLETGKWRHLTADEVNSLRGQYICK